MRLLNWSATVAINRVSIDFNLVSSYKGNLGVLIGLGRVCRLRLHPNRAE